MISAIDPGWPVSGLPGDRQQPALTKQVARLLRGMASVPCIPDAVTKCSGRPAAFSLPRYPAANHRAGADGASADIGTGEYRPSSPVGMSSRMRRLLAEDPDYSQNIIRLTSVVVLRGEVAPAAPLDNSGPASGGADGKKALMAQRSE